MASPQIIPNQTKHSTRGSPFITKSQNQQTSKTPRPPRAEQKKKKRKMKEESRQSPLSHKATAVAVVLAQSVPNQPPSQLPNPNPAQSPALPVLRRSSLSRASSVVAATDHHEPTKLRPSFSLPLQFSVENRK
jgi:hypothetical protein